MKQFLQFRNRTSFSKNWSLPKNFQFLGPTPKNVLKNQPRFLCTISGGQDSVLSFFVLLHTFELLSDKKYFRVKTMMVKKLPRDSRNFLKKKQSDLLLPVRDFLEETQDKVHVVYCHHFWQRKNFFSSLFVFRLTFLFRVPYILILPQMTFLTENSSRGWRKKNFYRVSQLERSFTVTTGHTETDSLEKNLNNLFRGTGSKGFSHFTHFNYKILQNLCFSILIQKSRNFLDLTEFLKPRKLFVKEGFPRPRSLPVTKGCFYPPLPLRKPRLQFLFSMRQTPVQVTEKFRFFSTKKVDSLCFTNTPATKENYISKKSTYSVSFCFYSNSASSKIISWKPLQTTRRSTVSQLINFYEFPLLTDFTNFSGGFSRNKIRHQFIPFIRTFFHKKIESLLLSCFTTIGKEQEEIEEKLVEFCFLCQFFDSHYLKKQSKAFKGDSTARVLGTTCYVNLQGHVLQKVIYDYRTIELNFLQISQMKNQLFGGEREFH